MDVELAMQVQNIDNPAAALTLVMTDRADSVMSWEPNTSAGLAKAPDLRVLYRAGDEYEKKTGHVLPYFSVAIRREVAQRQPDLAFRISKAFTECSVGIMANVDSLLQSNHCCRHSSSSAPVSFCTKKLTSAPMRGASAPCL